MRISHYPYNPWSGDAANTNSTASSFSTSERMQILVSAEGASLSEDTYVRCCCAEILLWFCLPARRANLQKEMVLGFRSQVGVRVKFAESTHLTHTERAVHALATFSLVAILISG